MSMHWNPEDEVARARGASVKPSWPEGATAGLLMLAAACVGLSLLLYRIAGPRDIFLG